MKSELSPEFVDRFLTTKMLGRNVETYPVALTTESLALGWLRQRQAPHGSLVVADREISPRSRSGSVITGEEPLAFSLILRPVIAVDYQDILWGTALTAACAGYGYLGIAAKAWWPEDVVVDDAEVGYVKVETQLAPGVVESSVVTFRLDFLTGVDRDGQFGALNVVLSTVEELLELAPTAIADRYLQICNLKTRPIRLNLRPSGASGGRAESIDERGGFGVAASSGSITRYGVDQIRDIVLRD